MRIRKNTNYAQRACARAQTHFYTPARHKKTRFSQITFFTVDLAVWEDLDFCCPSNEKFFATNYFSPGPFSPEIYGSKNDPFLTHLFLVGPTACFSGRIEQILVPFDQASFNLAPSLWKFFDPGPSWPAMARQTQKWPFWAVSEFFVE